MTEWQRLQHCGQSVWPVDVTENPIAFIDRLCPKTGSVPQAVGDVTTPFGAALLKARRLGEDVTREWENWTGVGDAPSDSASQPQ